MIVAVVMLVRGDDDSFNGGGSSNSDCYICDAADGSYVVAMVVVVALGSPVALAMMIMMVFDMMVFRMSPDCNENCICVA